MASVAVDPSMSTVATPIVVGSSPGSMITRTVRMIPISFRGLLLILHAY